MSVPFIPEIRGIPTIYGEVLEKDVSFCIDTSGSMYKSLDVVKEHLIETLMKQAKKPVPCTFNILEFNSDVTQWADKMVKCTPETVAVAADWVRKLSAKTGTNVLDALLTALSDQGCKAVYLVTDGLPDQHPQDILDKVICVSRNRPVHCIYLCSEESPDSTSIEFLEDLAVESYGSFHIVTLTQHGCVERITPIYRADHAHERIIRTLNGTMHNSAKTCGVSTTLQIDPEESLRLTPRVSLLGQIPPYADPLGKPYWWPLWHFQPYRYYYPHGWSRYRPAKGWLKAHEQMVNSMDEYLGVSPAAGALLINKMVLARRIDDGYFYLGKVQSQILSDKFLIAFGPCKHGKYKETVYQDTLVHDIIDYNDAQRHTIITGDRVLAPWEPDSERYGPGVVIDGHEKRHSEGPDDSQITVTFSNGKTEKVAADLAIWIPEDFFKRLTLELQMPKEARASLQVQENYPKENLPGYPTSGVKANPNEYEHPPPFYLDHDPVFIQENPWVRSYVPSYPMMQQQQEVMKAKAAVKSEEINKLIPGTDLTQQELNVKVMNQLVENKLLLDEKQTEKENREKEPEVGIQRNRYTTNWKSEEDKCNREEEETRKTKEELERALEEERLLLLERERDKHRKNLEEIDREIQMKEERLLKKRQKQEENMLKKSVSFRDEVEVEDLEQNGYMNGGYISNSPPLSDEEEKYREEFDFEKFAREEQQLRASRIRAGNREASYLFPRPRSRSENRPPWKKYWAKEEIPDIIDPPSHGAFRETALQTPLEARDQTGYPYPCEWTSPVYKFVDPYAKHDYSSSVEMLMKTPKPPEAGKYKQGPPLDMRGRPMSADAKEEARREYRRQRVAQRSREWNERLRNEDLMKEIMQDQHRERVIAQMERDRQRLQKEQRTVDRAREAKRHISAELRAKMEENERQKQIREQQRIEAMKNRREKREAAVVEKQKEAEEIAEKRQQVKMQRSKQRWNEVHERLEQEETENHVQAEKVRNAKLNRLDHFRKLEEEGQQKKDIRIKVSEQHLAECRSNVLP